MTNGVEFPFSPSLIPEIIRTFLEHKADVWFVWMLVATVALFVGILLDERVERIVAMRYRISDDGNVLEDEERARWQEVLRTIGFWLAVASIIGEGVCEFMGARAEGRVREFANTRVLIAQQQAVSANGRALEAIDRANHESQALLALQKKFVWQGPRNILLFDSQDAFKKALGGFAPQHFRMSVCRSDVDNSAGGSTNETFLAADAIRVSLSRVGWEQVAWQGWPVPSPLIIPNCFGGAGVFVSILPSASAATRNAANALRSVLESVLQQKPEFPVDRIIPGWGISVTGSAFPLDDMEVHVSRHPAFPGDPFKLTP